MAKSSGPRILHLDVETRPTLAYVWRSRKENINPEQVKEAEGIICWSAKWHGQKAMKFGAYWDDPKFLKKLWDLLVKADAVVTYNGDGFDLPKIRGMLLRHRLPPLPPVTSIDLYRTTRKMGFFSARLAYICWLLGIGAKVKHHGFKLWSEVLDGKESSRRLMKRYNKQDVKLLEEAYNIIKPHIIKHPRLFGKSACGTCGSTHLQSRGHRHTLAFSIERLQCQTCGKWEDGKRTKK